MPAMKRKLNQDDVPVPVTDTAKGQDEASPTSFSELGLDTRIIQATAREQFPAPTLIQSKAIPLILSGHHVVARAKTGSGKTLAYVLPIINAILQRKASGASSKGCAALILVPTKELASQVFAAIKKITHFCAQDIKSENVTRKEDNAVTKTRLSAGPDIVIATPGRANHWLNEQALDLKGVRSLVVDEADLILDLSKEDDLKNIALALPTGVQKVMTSATMQTEMGSLTSLFFPDDGQQPTILDLTAEEAAEPTALAQYSLRTAEDEKFLLIYAIFKLQLIKGKIIMFVADIDRCYRVKLFLEQFGVRSCVLNSEMPVNNRLHVVEEFNRGVYDIIVAADETEIVGQESARRKRRKVEKQEKQSEVEDKQPDPSSNQAVTDEPATAESGSKPQDDTKSAVTADGAATKQDGPRDRKARNRRDHEYGIARGVDFRHVTCVLNFDLPPSSQSYIHRIGRTARAGQTGMALSLFVPTELYRKHRPTSIPQCENDEETLESIKAEQATKGAEVQEWGLDWTKLDGFRYRLVDAIRSVTRIAIREARTKELRNALINSEKLKRHFEENPEDLQHLRHDTETHAIRQQHHLRHVPDYLLPSGGRAAVNKDVGSVSIWKDDQHGKGRHFNKNKGKKFAKKKGMDPLKSLNARGRGKR